MSLGGPFGALLGFLLADRIGRKRGIVIVSLIAAALGVAYANAPAIWLATAIGFALFTCIYVLVAFVFAVYVPEYVVQHWWETLLHNQSALRLKVRLRQEHGVIVVSVPLMMIDGTSDTAAPVLIR